MSIKQQAFLIIFGAFFSLACGVQENKTPGSELDIVNGMLADEANPVAKSTVAILGYDLNGKWISSNICSGTLITPIHVLTAAHCAEGYNERVRPRVVFEKTLKEEVSADNVRFAYSWKQHEDYRDDLMTVGVSAVPINDIAIILLNAPAPEGYEPVAIADADAELERGDVLVIAGYGVTREKNSSGVLRWGRNYFYGDLPRQKEVVGASYSKEQTCGGDSGGPTFIVKSDANQQPVLSVLGVTSRGDELCQFNGFNSDVRKFSDWIANTANQLLNDAVASTK